MKYYFLLLSSIFLFSSCNWMQENIWGTPESKLDKTIVAEKSAQLTDLKGTYISEKGIDISSSEISFYVDGLSETKGRFKEFDIELNADDQACNIAVSINASSVFTANEMRDEHLLNEDFFDTENHPAITFNASNITPTDSGYIAIGTLALLGVENKITVPFNYLGSSEDEHGNQSYVFEGKVAFDRIKYGMKEAQSVGNNVTLNFYTELLNK